MCRWTEAVGTTVANEGMLTKLKKDKIKQTNITGRKMWNAKSQWGNMASYESKNQKSGCSASKSQSLICKAIVPQLSQLDMLLQSKKKGGEAPSTKDLIRLAMDSLKLITFVYCDMSYRRRELTGAEHSA